MTDNYWTTRRVSRRTVLRGSIVGLAGTSAAALIGCGGSEDAATSTGTGAAPATKAPLAFKRGGIVRMGSPAISGGLDPVYSGSGYHKTRVAFDTLLDTDDKDQPGIRDDALAASMELSDPTTLILKLRPGVKFHDGTPFNAEAVKFNVARTLQATPPGQPHKAMLLTTDRVEAVDELTVKSISSSPMRRCSRPSLTQRVRCSRRPITRAKHCRMCSGSRSGPAAATCSRITAPAPS